ncbi:MAG: hypothetical protein Q8K86_08965 [Candidatus Nanopelagicaceae bacterium]|nr:hypothetical protein [Candidatus Nanopelagicaceae bacterium]
MKIAQGLAVMLFCVTIGCAPRPAIDNAVHNNNVVVAIEKGAKSVVNFALVQCAKKNKEATLKAAIEADKVLTEVIIPYLNSQETGVTSFVINEYLKEKCFSKFSDEVVAAIVSASEIVDTLVQPPDPNTQMSESELKALQAFFTGIQQGLQKFVSDQIPKAVRGVSKAGWFK